jgi:cytochrome c
MKKYTLILSLAFFCVACGDQSKKEETSAAEPEKSTTSVMDNPDYDKGLNLIAKSDCFTCHKLREPATGPSYGDVALKYENSEENLNMLADKIIKGGQGNWGQIPMTPHPDISKEDAVAMVKYIFLLKEEKK